jgi:deoxyhypusine synthase
MATKQDLLTNPIQHIEIAQHNVVPLVDAMASMAYSSRDAARAAQIYEMMLRDRECGVILCLAGSLISAGLQKLFVDMVRHNMVTRIFLRRSDSGTTSRAMSTSTVSTTASFAS